MIQKFPVISLLFVVAMAALLSVFSKQTLTRVDALTFSWLQVCSGVLLLLFYNLFITHQPLKVHLSFKGWLLVIAIALLNFVSSRLFFLLGLEHLSVVSHAYIINFTGIVTMLLSIFLLKHYPTWLQWVGALIALVGLHIYFGDIPNGKQALGIFYTSMVVVSLALTNNLVRLFLTGNHALDAGQLSVWTGLIGGSILLGIGVIDTLQQQGANLAIQPLDWLIVLANGFFVITLGLTVFNYVLAKLASYEVSLLASSGVIFSAVFSWFILGDKLSPDQLFGIIVLFFGLVLVQIRRSEKRQSGKSTTAPQNKD